jgi:hypothetical protein
MMTGKAYYITTLADWQRHSHRFAQSHFVVLDAPLSDSVEARHAVPGENASEAVAHQGAASSAPTKNDGASAKILTLVEADEGAHLALEDDPAFEALPHPLAQKPISASAQSALAAHGVAPGATTFDAAEALARIHPLLKYRVF